MSARSGVTMVSWIELGSPSAMLLGRLHLLGLLASFFDRAYHVKRLLGEIIMLSVDNFPKPLDGVLHLHVSPCFTGKLLGNEEGLRQEPLNLPRPSNDQFVFFRQLINTENRNDVLQILVLLQNSLDRARTVVVVCADYAGVQNSGR